ncbi:membrane dipeptidase-domain-containing protein [Mycena belliarum]|uniref:Dipeptidase n=1 Tax=Mycena belliarum TaxID=1033014 RepID=A0AAD6XH71_9AGAR|nr:membrane dipeptidase-domain-containing protein [Mycena belliae]
MSPSPSPSPERQSRSSRDALNQAILGLGKSYLSSFSDPDADLDNGTPAESTPLLPQSAAPQKTADPNKTRAAVWAGLTSVFAAALIVLLCFPHLLPDALAPLVGRLPRDPTRAALAILSKAPVIDGHIDLPIRLRIAVANNVSAVDLEHPFVGHVDIPRLRKGKVGGFFWSVYVPCADPAEEGEDFLTSTWRVRDTLEQIDVARLTIDKYPDASSCNPPSSVFQPALSSEDIKAATSKGKIASLLGVEGSHQLGNSLAVLRQYHALGVRYVTLTHTCHNAFADSCGMAPGMEPLHGGLSPFGRRLIGEMNRLGVLVDLSHTSDDTARQALGHSRAPVIWSHSSARAVHDVPRNVPDDILALVGTGEGQTDAVVMVNFAPAFVAPPGNATVYAVADHVEHIAKVAGKKHVGIGSDFDGIESTPVGLEDVSKYPALFAELYTRGWTQHELEGLAGANLLRVFEGAERIARVLQAAGTLPAFDVYPKRTDLPPKLPAVSH